MLMVQNIVSDCLAGNLLHDPTERDLVVHLPPGYEASERRYPTLYLLHGVGMHARAWTYPFPHGGGLLPPVDEIFDAAVAKRLCLARSLPKTAPGRGDGCGGSRRLEPVWLEPVGGFARERTV